MAIGTYTCHAWLDEILDIQKVADTGTRRRIDDAEFLRDGAEIFMVVRIAEAGLHHTMVDEIDGKRFDPFHAHGFELQHAHGAGCILGERLIYCQCDHLASGRQLPATDLMCRKYFFRQIHRFHLFSSQWNSCLLIS